MNIISSPRISRRDWLRRSAAATLAFGLWPGCATHRENGRGGDFSFIQINDTHFSSPQCPEFFKRVALSIRAHRPVPELCLVVGDLAENGTSAELGGMRDALRDFGIPFHAVIGNHDYTTQQDRTAWNQLFPRSLNYSFEHRQWQFVGLDSSEGQRYEKTRIQPMTLQWVDDRLRKLDRKKPVVLFTHFPLGPGVTYRPVNADGLLERFRDFNLVAVFNGHFHGFTERRVGDTVFTTDKCCAIARGNHDKTKEKGYFLCRAGDGQITRQFIEVSTG